MSTDKGFTTNKAAAVVSEEQVELAAIALANVHRGHPNPKAYWAWMHEDEQAKFRERATAALEAALSSQWRPIADHPKGRAILVHYKNALGKGRVIKAEFITQFTVEADSESDHFEYNEDDDTYYTPEGWYELIDNWGDFSSVQMEHVPDSWQPLPEPPK